MEILPHRYPMLLVDRITEFEPMKFARAATRISPSTSRCSPGTSRATRSCRACTSSKRWRNSAARSILEPGDLARKIPYLAGIDKAKFRRPVVPGDRLMMEVTRRAHAAQHRLGRRRSDASTAQFVCSAELMFSIAADPSAFANDASILHQ